MALLKFVNSLAATGVRKEHQPWEAHLTRKLNLSSMLGIFNVAVGLIVFFSVGYYSSIFECVVVLIIAPFMFFLNSKYGYVPALYLFTFIGCFLFFFLSVRMGDSSFAFLYYFPLLIGIIQMAGRKELFKHLLVLVAFCVISILAIVLSYHFKLFQVQLSEALILRIRYVNIFFSFFTSIMFVFIISVETIQQEAQLKTALQQKEVLLAELFHRVKNNLNIVTSLLNLKKNSITSPEAKKALEECRSLVFSMALVHAKIYKNSADDLNFSDYLHDLVPELINSIGGRDNVDFELSSTPLQLSLAQAIPCGLIINELITNSFKHAQLPGKKLKIKVDLKRDNNYITVNVGDNGPGRKTMEVNTNSIGIELIKSLSGQLDAEYAFTNQEGFHFNLKFKH